MNGTWDMKSERRKNFSLGPTTAHDETTNEPSLLKTLVCVERQQHENMPEEYLLYKKKLSTRHGLGFYEDRIIVTPNLRTTVISLLHKGHRAISKMSMAVRHFWWRSRITEAIQKRYESCVPCKMSGKNINYSIPSTEKAVTNAK